MNTNTTPLITDTVTLGFYDECPIERGTRSGEERTIRESCGGEGLRVINLGSVAIISQNTASCLAKLRDLFIMWGNICWHLNLLNRVPVR